MIVPFRFLNGIYNIPLFTVQIYPHRAVFFVKRSLISYF